MRTNDWKQELQKDFINGEGTNNTHISKMNTIIKRPDWYLLHGNTHPTGFKIDYDNQLNARLVINKEVDMLEAKLFRRQLLLPQDIKSVFIKNVCDYFVTPTSQIIVEQAKKQRLFVN